MFDDINKMMNVKMKTFQQQIRAQDERIVALETENAMLYLKLAQCQGNLRTTKQGFSYHQHVNEEEEKFRLSLKEKLMNADEQVKSLHSELKSMKLEVKDFLDNVKTGAMFSEVDGDNNGLSSMLRNIKTSQSMDTEALQSKLLQAEQERDEAERRSNMERSRRRTLHNTLIELRGNIRVHCRVRPLLAVLDSNGDEALLEIAGTQSEKIVGVLDEENVTFNQINHSNSALNKSRSFEYERVYRPTDDQDAVFNDVAPLLTSLLDGYNVCIMAYGQTGSGKTHTMVGDHGIYDEVSLDDLTQEYKQGIIPRAAKELIRLMKERERTTEKFYLEICVFEVYNNEIIDLLSSESKRDVKHAVFSASDGSQEIPSLTTRKVTSAKEVMDYVTYGMTHRHEDSTKIHSHSSRSHLIVQLNIYRTNTIAALSSSPSTDQSSDATRKNVTLGGGFTDVRSGHARSRSPGSKHSKSYVPVRRITTPSPTTQQQPQQLSVNKNKSIAVKTKLQLVDLAGSECVGMSGVTGSALRETSNINKSLSALADVLQALSENQNHIPYRNTKLTHILQDTIGGDSKLLVMLCVSPVQKYTTETLQCLGFGSRTRQVARGPAKKRRPTGYNMNIPSTLSDSLTVRPSSSLIRSSSTKR